MISQIVSLEIKDGCLDEFLEAIGKNAESSVANEPGCRAFSVNQSRANPQHFFLFEVYEDDAAIDAHRQAPHFLAWRQVAQRVVVPGSQTNTVCRHLVAHP